MNRLGGIKMKKILIQKKRLKGGIGMPKHIQQFILNKETFIKKFF